jgi:hypothetical protein
MLFAPARQPNNRCGGEISHVEARPNFFFATGSLILNKSFCPPPAFGALNFGRRCRSEASG